MSKKYQKPIRPASRRHTVDERSHIVEKFRAARGKGVQPENAIKGLGTSLSSIYRWQREQYASSGMPKPTKSQEISIDDAIYCLTGHDSKDKILFLESLFKLISWLRWPNRPADHPAAMTVCIVAYLSQSQPAETLDQLDTSGLNLLLRNVRLDAIKRLFSQDIYMMPSFELWNRDDQPYTELDFLAQIVWFILMYQNTSTRSRDKASLNKAFFVTQNGGFRYRWQMTQKTFRTLWIDKGVSAPFHFVERYHSNVDLTLDPSLNDFAESIDDLYRRRDDLRTYLARCRSVIEELRDRLDPRALQLMHFPKFPANLPPQNVEHPVLPAVIPAVMNGFGRGD